MIPEYTDIKKVRLKIYRQNRNKINQFFDGVEFINWGLGKCFILFNNNIFYVEMSYHRFNKRANVYNMMIATKIKKVDNIEYFLSSYSYSTIMYNNEKEDPLEKYNKIINTKRKLNIESILS